MKKISQEELREAMVSSLPNLWRFAISLCGRADMADDLVQITCLRALERSHQIYDLSGVRRWLITICRSVWYNERRAQAVRQFQSLDSPEGESLASELLSAETNIFFAEVFTKVMHLPEAQRSVVVLVLVEGYTYREAAEILDVPIGTIMSRLSSARAKIGQHLEDAPAQSQQKVPK